MTESAQLSGEQEHKHRLVYARTLCFIENGNDILLLKGASTKRLYPNLFNGVGGHVEAGEDVLTSLRREVREETGLEIENPRLRAVLNVDEASKPGVVVFVFLATTSTRWVKPSAEGQLYWIPREHIYDFDLVKDLYQLLPRILNPAVNGLWYGYYKYDEAGNLVQISFALDGCSPAGKLAVTDKTCGL